MPAFKKPKSSNAATTLLLMGALAVTMFIGIIVLALKTGVQFADNPPDQLDRRPAEATTRRR